MSIQRRSVFRFMVTIGVFFFLWSAFANVTLALTCCNCHPNGNAALNVCLTDANSACGGNAIITNSANPDVAGYTCDPTPLDIDSSCKPVSAGGSAKCAQGPIDVSTFHLANATTSGNTLPKPIVPTLNIPIPGLTFSNQLPITVVNGEQAVSVPLLAQYISAVYRYLLGISVLAAAVMIIYGGFRYIVGSTLSTVKSGQEIIRNAVIGLLLVLSLYTILQLINPATLSLQAVNLTLVKPDPLNTYMGAAQDAPGLLTGLGMNARSKRVPQDDIAPNAGGPVGEASIIGNEIAPPSSVSRSPTNLTIPQSCAGRDASNDPDARITMGGKKYYAKNKLAIQLTDDVIKEYLREQSRTGIPAGVLIAQIMSETGATASAKCIVQNMFSDPSKCGNAPYFKAFNFGGIGCTARQVPSGVCPNLALPKSGQSCDDSDGPNTFNKYLAACTTACSQNPSASSYDCGKDCYPQPSTASAVINGQEVRWSSIQCSRIFKNAQDFLDTHLGFAQYCLPYNDSVYKFAYCIGASSYATDGNKAAFLAEVIERNCLCGSKDSTGCKRDLTLENNLSKSIIHKTNLYQFQKGDNTAIIEALSKATKGALTPTDYIKADNLSRIANPE